MKKATAGNEWKDDVGSQGKDKSPEIDKKVAMATQNESCSQKPVEVAPAPAPELIDLDSKVEEVRQGPVPEVIDASLKQGVHRMMRKVLMKELLRSLKIMCSRVHVKSDVVKQIFKRYGGALKDKKFS